MKKILLLACLLAAVTSVIAQGAKKNPPKPAETPSTHSRKISFPHPAVPPAENPFGLPSVKRQPLPALVPQTNPTAANIRVIRDKNGLPILLEGKTTASQPSAGPEAGALAYLASLQLTGIADPALEFRATGVETDEAGNRHIRLEQIWKGIPVYGGEVIAHTHQDAFDMLNGRYYPTPELASAVPALDADRAVGQVKKAIGEANIKTDWTSEQLKLLKTKPFQAELVVYHHNRQLNNERLAWLVEAHPNLLRRLIYFIDANTGEVIHHFDHTCQIGGGRHEHSDPAPPEPAMPVLERSLPTAGFDLPPVVASGVDLLGQNRSFGAWLQSGTYYLEDASKAMFNSASSNMPGDPIGVVVTLNAGNTSPENSNFDYSLVTSASTTFNNANAVSSHWNAIKSYEYFETTHGRNSIDGVGGNIISFFNVSESNGSSMENAYWNGAAMWYGSGGSTFKALARGLDVGGHEMTHGVVEKTANLVYQDESGALNESFADVFGAMIDRDDWLIGEDVMQAGTNAALRSLQDPHNGVNSNSPWWQPRHVNEQYNGSADNGGVHINSGIPNYAYYLFANNASVGKDKAEKVYYKALKDYLVKSSQFVDLRIAVLKAAGDLYGNTVANAAASAFDQVGIVGNTPGGNYLGQLAVNPGTDYVLCVTNNFQNLEVRNGSGQLISTIYNQGLQSRPSVSDNGSQLVFVNAAGHVIYVDLVYTPAFMATVNPPLSDFPEWRNAVISKDGAFIAALTSDKDNLVYVFNLFTGESESFELYNPTYSTGQVTGEVQYADVLEFDYSGEYLMYDAFNQLSNSQTNLSYWDIGFLQFWENGGFADPSNAFISKLFNGLPEKTSVGNPTLAKNSPYIIAFDYYDELNDKNDIYAANLETGDLGVILENNGAYSWPNYNRLDNALIYEGPNQNSVTNIYRRPLAADKINPAGNESQFIADRQWGVWFANGNRSLSVGTAEPGSDPLQIEVAPNPAVESAWLKVISEVSVSARVSVSDLTGVRVQEREVQLAEGENQLEVNLRSLPSGTYVVRIFTGNAGKAFKLVKQ